MERTKKKQEMKESNFLALMLVVSILVILIGGLITYQISKSLIHDQKILSKKSLANKTLVADIKNAKSLVDEYNNLGSRQALLTDSLPNEPDFPGLANAIEVISGSAGVELTNIDSGDGGVVTSGAGATVSAPQVLPINIKVNASYVNLGKFLNNIESSSRPIHISDIQLAGTNIQLSVKIAGNSYYQNTAAFEVQKEVLK